MPGIVIRFPDLVQRREEVLTELLSVLGCEGTPVFSENRPSHAQNAGALHAVDGRGIEPSPQSALAQLAERHVLAA